MFCITFQASLLSDANLNWAILQILLLHWFCKFVCLLLAWMNYSGVFLLIPVGLYFSNFSYISFLGVNFKNLTVEFHVPYVLNMHIKFCSNQILFIVWSINLFFIYNFRLQKLQIIIFIWWHNNWFLIFLKFCKH